jgi:hypothetical protein
LPVVSDGDYSSIAIAAMAHPEPAKRGRGNKSPVPAIFPMVNHQRLSEARTVLEFATDLAPGVLAGSDLPYFSQTRCHRNKAEIAVVFGTKSATTKLRFFLLFKLVSVGFQSFRC